LELGLPTDNPDAAIARAAERGSGAAFGLGFTLFRALTDTRNSAAWLKLMPRALGGLPKAYEALQTGQVTGPNGGAIVKFDVQDTEQMLEVLAMAAGVTPARMALEYDADREVYEVLQFWSLRRDAILRQLAETVRMKDMTERKSVLESIRYYNATLPKDPMYRGLRITSEMAVQSVKARNRNIRLQEMNIPARRGDRPVAEGIRRLYEGDPTVQDVRRVQ